MAVSLELIHRRTRVTEKDPFNWFCLTHDTDPLTIYCDDKETKLFFLDREGDWACYGAFEKNDKIVKNETDFHIVVFKQEVFLTNKTTGMCCRLIVIPQNVGKSDVSCPSTCDLYLGSMPEPHVHYFLSKDRAEIVAHAVDETETRYELGQQFALAGSLISSSLIVLWKVFAGVFSFIVFDHKEKAFLPTNPIHVTSEVRPLLYKETIMFLEGEQLIMHNIRSGETCKVAFLNMDESPCLKEEKEQRQNRCLFGLRDTAGGNIRLYVASWKGTGPIDVHLAQMRWHNERGFLASNVTEGKKVHSSTSTTLLANVPEFKHGTVFMMPGSEQLYSFRNDEETFDGVISSWENGSWVEEKRFVVPEKGSWRQLQDLSGIVMSVREQYTAYAIVFSPTGYSIKQATVPEGADFVLHCGEDLLISYSNKVNSQEGTLRIRKEDLMWKVPVPHWLQFGTADVNEGKMAFMYPVKPASKTALHAVSIYDGEVRTISLDGIYEDCLLIKDWFIVKGNEFFTLIHIHTKQLVRVKTDNESALERFIGCHTQRNGNITVYWVGPKINDRVDVYKTDLILPSTDNERDTDKDFARKLAVMEEQLRQLTIENSRLREKVSGGQTPRGGFVTSMHRD